MQFKFYPHTDKDTKDMLAKIGVKSLDGLYAQIPESIRLQKSYDIPKSKSEIEIRNLFTELGKQNEALTVFAGGGVYDHYTPSVVPYLVSRSEYLTSYTPYQAEISQGTLHYIFEYQSMMAELTGMDISNASMYDGATATAEAMMMANANAKKADTVLVSKTVDPKTISVVETYAKFHGVKVQMIEEKDGVTDKADMESKLSQGNVSGVVVQQPNYYGVIEDYQGYADSCHNNKALFIMNAAAADLAILKTPGEWGADIAVGDGQSLGLPMHYGGAYVGYLCCSEKLLRKMPGRIVGETKDSRGQRAFVLTMQAREQHIRRQKATSNICSNQSLMALSATIYMSLMGKEGLKEAAAMSYAGAHYLCDALVKSGKFSLKYNKPFFNEFCLTYNGNVDALQKKWLAKGFLGGIKIDEHTIMLAVTEKRTQEEIDRFVQLAMED